jgi:hypothetical protein
MQKFLTSGKVFYCPAYPRHDFDYNSFPEPWLFAPLKDAAYDTWRTSYLCLPHAGANGGARYKKLREIPADRTLALDICFQANTGHVSKGGPSWNLVFKDGHVSTVTSRFAADALEGRLAADPMGTIAKASTDNTTQKSWQYNHSNATNVDTYRDILETEAAGRSPRTSAIGGGKPMSNSRVSFGTGGSAPPPGL